MLNIDNPYFEQMVVSIKFTELQINKANSFYSEASILDLDTSVTNILVLSKMYDKKNDFNFEIVNLSFLD